MTQMLTINTKISIRQLSSIEDYDDGIIFQQFMMACEANPILGFANYFGFMPLLDISEIYMEENLYQSLSHSLEERMDGLLEGYSDSVIELIEEQLDEGAIKHINTDYDWVFHTSMNEIFAVTFMLQKKSEDQGVCLYFGPDISPEHLKQLIDGISEKDDMNCDTSNGCTA